MYRNSKQNSMQHNQNPEYNIPRTDWCQSANAIEMANILRSHIIMLVIRLDVTTLSLKCWTSKRDPTASFEARGKSLSSARTMTHIFFEKTKIENVRNNSADWIQKGGKLLQAVDLHVIKHVYFQANNLTTVLATFVILCCCWYVWY